MRHVLHTLCLAVTLLFSVLPAVAGDLFRVESVGARDGSTVGIVSTAFIDRAGFLWTASNKGLIRFDGYSTKLFPRDPADPTSLSDNIVRTIFEAPDGRLWIGTNGGGLNLLDRATGAFIRYLHDPDDPGSISHDCVQSKTGTARCGSAPRTD